MSKKPKCFSEGEEVEFETKQGRNEKSSITEDVRERAMRAIAAGGQKDEEKPKAAPKKAAPKKETRVTPQSQYDYNDMENGPGEKTKEDREMVRKAYIEAANMKSGKNKPAASEETKADPEKVRKAYIESAKYVGRPSGMKSGGTVRKSASSRADGCAIRGKTRA